MRLLRTASLYFALVFSAGFVLGPIRVLWAVPRFGERMAELMEAPLMLVVIVLAARWLVRRAPDSPWRQLAVGCLALGFVLAAEFGVVLGLRGMSLEDYLASRDPVGGAVYVVLLLVFAVAPALLSRCSTIQGAS